MDQSARFVTRVERMRAREERERKEERGALTLGRLPRQPAQEQLARRRGGATVEGIEGGDGGREKGERGGIRWRGRGARARSPSPSLVRLDKGPPFAPHPKQKLTPPGPQPAPPPETQHPPDAASRRAPAALRVCRAGTRGDCLRRQNSWGTWKVKGGEGEKKQEHEKARAPGRAREEGKGENEGEEAGGVVVAF